MGNSALTRLIDCAMNEYFDGVGKAVIEKIVLLIIWQSLGSGLI